MSRPTETRPIFAITNANRRHLCPAGAPVAPHPAALERYAEQLARLQVFESLHLGAQASLTGAQWGGSNASTPPGATEIGHGQQSGYCLRRFARFRQSGIGRRLRVVIGERSGAGLETSRAVSAPPVRGCRC
jgi:hypothetical protein